MSELSSIDIKNADRGYGGRGHSFDPIAGTGIELFTEFGKIAHSFPYCPRYDVFRKK